MFLIGLSKTDITVFEKGASMLGYGLFSHISLDVDTPLYARAFILEDKTSGNKLCIVNCELCFITPALKQGVVAMLQKNNPEININDNNLILSAQHTHCSPAGYSYHAIYNVSVPGFHKRIYNTLVKGITKAIVEADLNKTEGGVHYGKSTFAPDIPVSFNRTVNSYNQNPEVTKYKFSERHLAVDREMRLIEFVSKDGNPMGSINWFAVHTTNLPNNFTKISSDNKGYAAKYLEREKRKSYSNYIAAFAQGACGDVSARVKYNPRHNFQRGNFEGFYPDDIKSSKFNGGLQFEKADEITENLNNTLINEHIDIVTNYFDFSNLDIDKKYTNGEEGCCTSPSVMGLSFLEGSKMDGPGMPPIIAAFAKIMAQRVKHRDLLSTKKLSEAEADKINRKYKAQGNKNIIIESGDKRLLGFTDLRKLPLPKFSDPTIRNLKDFAEKGIFDDYPWAPQILPIQVARIGTIAIVSLPFEITTVASWRLRKTIEDLLSPHGIETVILCPYANAYNGYITTPEEYDVQDYEGGHCVFGRWSLNALQQVCVATCEELLKPKADRTQQSVHLPKFTNEYLEQFEYHKSAYYKRIEKKLERKEGRLDKRHNKYTDRQDNM